MADDANPAEGIALAFVATKSGTSFFAIDALRHQYDLRCWIENFGLITEPGRVEASDLKTARQLRWAMLEALQWAIDGIELSPVAVQLINSLAAKPGPQRQLTDGRVIRTGDINAAFAGLATDLLDLLDGPDRDRLRWCRDRDCRRPMVDRSRGGTRIWCGKACRERNNAYEYRDRLAARERATRPGLIAYRG